MINIELLTPEIGQKLYLDLGDRVEEVTFMWMEDEWYKDTHIAVATKTGTLLNLHPKRWDKLSLFPKIKFSLN